MAPVRSILSFSIAPYQTENNRSEYRVRWRLSSLAGWLLGITRIRLRRTELPAARELHHVFGFPRVRQLHRLPGLLRLIRVSLFRTIVVGC